MLDLQRNNVRVLGRGPRTMVLAHGFGCDQSMWRYLIPAFQDEYRLVVFDHIGHGQSDSADFDPKRYATLDGYADDILKICAALAIHDAVFVGHSVSGMMGVLAANKERGRFGALVLIGPSPRYVNDEDYAGGFTREDVDGLLEFLDSNHLGWSSTMAPVIMGNPERPALSEELANSFCRTDPEIARHFARVTFLADNRTDLQHVAVPTLILQCSQDAIAPEVVGHYVRDHIPGSVFVQLRASGHCPHLSEPEETVAAIRAFLAKPASQTRGVTG
jgi:sigma-B regulation protein RsbQ